ncbi:N-acetylmuramidase domain-containing protein [Parapedobacter soli]|uniref:N-acetylmuramidase domain-containing protein n=1 Tax=Parapedobacter soli TaxID=416955 RepID=UPI0021C790A9|nr:N-acetylmuramidase domain-containing protein [Parapedobacter soli]
MKLLKINSHGDAVELLQELLNEYGYRLVINGVFDNATEQAVRSFQTQHDLVSDGIVYTKTWTKLINGVPIDMSKMEEKYLKESDIRDLANSIGVDAATIKAVNEVESRGRGFDADGNPKILFEGHVFWKELENRGINPAAYAANHADILYKKWTKAHYKGGIAEYDRLTRAINLIPNNSKVAEAAYASASWGLFQIMGYHYKALGYDSVIEFVGDMQLNEGKQLQAFGKFLKSNQLIDYLKNKQWAEFARHYNGPGYATNHYDRKLKEAYQRHVAVENQLAPKTTRTLIKKGSTGVLVGELQAILNELDYAIPQTGVFDTATDRAVKAFQASHLDKHQQPLSVDGVVGQLTWWALENPRPRVTDGVIEYHILPPVEYGESQLGRAALRVAIGELKAGAGEVGGNNKGPWVRKYLEPAGLPEGNPWCAAFISWCFLQAVGGDRREMPFHYSAGARDIFNQLKNKGWSYTGESSKQPTPGDIVCWWRTSLASGNGHIGLVHHCKDGFLYTIEGNKAANVAGFSYVKTRMDKLLGFARVS